MIVLGIESTCDETGCALVENGKSILSNVVSTQIDLHAEFGGVVPELACRRHLDVIIPVIDQALAEANLTLDQVDLIAAAHAPGLIGALLVGLNSAKALSLTLEKPFVGVNHIEAHLYAALMSHEDEIAFPCLGATLSGGHTSLFLMHSPNEYELISETVDDAIGEAFDKVAKLIGLPYPGGPHVEQKAKSGDCFRYPLKAGRVKGKPLHFSFSGLKTAVLYTSQAEADALNINDLCASFQHAACIDVVKKTKSACKQFHCNTLLLGGGVTNNRYLRELFAKEATEINLIWPRSELTLDNAAMIAGLGYHKYQQQGADSITFEAKSRVI